MPISPVDGLSLPGGTLAGACPVVNRQAGGRRVLFPDQHTRYGTAGRRSLPRRQSLYVAGAVHIPADMVVAKEVIVELKAMENNISNKHIAKCLNCLRASGSKKRIIINVGRSRLEYRRVIF
jgi:hypothetical protein